MAQLRQHESKLNELKIDVKIVTFDADFMAISYVNETKLQWPLLLDKSMQLYKAYGMEQGSWWSISNPLAIWKYVLLILKGRMPGKPGSNLRQMGGDVLIDPNKIVRLHYTSTDPHDRPAVEQILNIVEMAKRQG